MAIELTYLVWSIALFFVMILAQSVASIFSGKASMSELVGPRDAALFFWGRVVFAPTYWLGVPWVRTLAWFVSIAGILMILWELLT